MKKYASSDMQRRLGEVIDSAQRAPVVIERRGRAVAVIMSAEQFKEEQEAKREWLRGELKEGELQANRGEFVDYDINRYLTKPGTEPTK